MATTRDDDPVDGDDSYDEAVSLSTTQNDGDRCTNCSVKILCMADYRLGPETIACLSRYVGLESIHLHNVQITVPPRGGIAAAAAAVASAIPFSPAGSFLVGSTSTRRLLRCLTTRLDEDGDDPDLLLRWLAAFSSTSTFGDLGEPSAAGPTTTVNANSNAAAPLLERLELTLSARFGRDDDEEEDPDPHILRLLSSMQHVMENYPASDLVLRLNIRDHRCSNNIDAYSGDDHDDSRYAHEAAPSVPHHAYLCAGIVGALPCLTSLVLHLRGNGAPKSWTREVLDTFQRCPAFLGSS